MNRGNFIVVDGVDGVGKSVIELALLERIGGEVFDSVSWSKENLGERPDVSLTGECDVVLTAEPTYSGLGSDIRRTLISNLKRGVFPYGLLIGAYSLDRDIQLRNLVLPVLARGRDVVQSRSVASSLCYQTLSAEDEGLDPVAVRDEVLRSTGNVFELSYAPDLLIIPTIGKVEDLMLRFEARGKKDDAIFEKMDFLERVKVCYESDWLREIFEKSGSAVAYLDAGISIESTREQAIDIYDAWLATGKIPREFRKIPSS
ncbi:hypothetical protein HN903_00445 [archaeon]|jgi:thymidylate kinase|nr:hypothetical protein [archaeon]MBT7128204.1 hypothetical protein [archaeon]